MIVSAVNEAAAESGLFQGMTLADARTHMPLLDTAPADPLADASLLERIVRWCGRYTPWTAVDGLDSVWLDTTGCAHLFGNEQAMLDDLIDRLEQLGFDVRAALADTPGTAWAVARYGINGSVVTRGGVRSALAFLPTAALRLSDGMADNLSRLGLRSIGDLFEIPRAPLAARFGGDLVLRLDQALGNVNEPISPISEKPRYHVRTFFAEPIGDYRSIAGGLDCLIDRICCRLDRGGHGCRCLEFTLYRIDGTLQQLRVGTSRPIRNPKHLARLFASRLDTLDSGFGIEAMTLVAPVTELLAVTQSSFSARSSQFSTCEELSSCEGLEILTLSPSLPFADAGLGRLIDSLGNRLGFDAVVRLAPRESFLPERVTSEVPVFGNSAPCWGSLSSVSRESLRQPLRPLRLFVWPELVETTALVTFNKITEQDTLNIWNRELPEEGGPPMMFRWRRVIHQVKAAEGPERIAPEWWREDKSWGSGSRDYWRVEDSCGHRFWLYREVVVHAKSTATPRWFLHGLFA